MRDLSGDLADDKDLSGDLADVSDLAGVLADEISISGDHPGDPSPVIVPVIHPEIVPVINPVIARPVLGVRHRGQQAVQTSLGQELTEELEVFNAAEYLERPLSHCLSVLCWRIGISLSASPCFPRKPSLSAITRHYDGPMEGLCMH